MNISTFPSLVGYKIASCLYQGTRTLVYRGTRSVDDKPVIIKFLRNEYPSFSELVQFRNQYTIAKNLNLRGIVQPLALETYRNSYALVMPDQGYISLQSSVMNQPLSISDFLKIAIQLAEILHGLYQNRIIHKDIKPANILIHPETKQIKLIDFSISSLLPKETQEIQNPNILEGTLAYISPEQTGRMNRGIDYRTDFYSLGITLFELLTEQLPFQSNDPMELVHCHIAKVPIFPNTPQLQEPDPRRPWGAGVETLHVTSLQESGESGATPVIFNHPEPAPSGDGGNAHQDRRQETGGTSNTPQPTPHTLQKIILKLMAKNAEDRYQSALGLKYDLEKCLSQYQETQRIEVFELGERDICDRFIIPEKLYGREREVQALLDAFERVSNSTPEKHNEEQITNDKQQSEMMLVAGFSGIGKTAVINEVHKPIVRQRGYFIKGKFDQFNRNIPFSAFVQAFRDLMGQLLSESETQLQTWKNKILEALGENAQVLIEVIPELESIIGSQPAIAELSGTAAQNRFNLLFSKFVKVFTTKEHPLVLFIDDLQWADSASLNLLKLLIGDTEIGYLLVLGSYRDNEVFPAHPLMLTLNDITKNEAILNTISLEALTRSGLNDLIADTLSCPVELAFPLTEFIYQKTQGNPFFATQFLKGLYEDGEINFNLNVGYWQCDIARVRQLSLTDDVVEFMATQLHKLPSKTQDILKLAACIGNQFDLKTLAVICELNQDQLAVNLWSALQEGFVIPESETYKFFQGERQIEENNQSVSVRYRFLHDRVQQAAYALIEEDRKQFTHYQIGRLLLHNSGSEKQTDQIFDIVNQLNLGQDIISNPVEKCQLAQLNYQAGQKAKLSSAYQAAQNYYEVGIDLLPQITWQSDYELMYKLHQECSEAAYLCGNYDRAETLYATTLSQAQTALDQAVIYRVQMTQYQLQGRNAEAIAIQRQSLKLLGWQVPDTPENIQASLDQQIATVDQFLEQSRIESILELPKMQDENIAEMLRILQILFYAAFLNGQTNLGLLAAAKMTTLSLQYGNSDISPFGYVSYGMIANTLIKNSAIAYQFGSMAVQLCEQFDNADVRGMTNFLFAADVQSWSRPIREADPYYESAFQSGMEAGNWLTVSFMMMQSGSDRLTSGKHLEELYEIARTHADFLQQVKSLENRDALMVGVLQPIRDLLGLTVAPNCFNDDNFSEVKYLEKYSNTPYHLAWFYSVKIRHAYLFQQSDQYLDLIPKLDIVENTVPSHAKVPSSVFYVALMHLSLVNVNDEIQEQFHWQAVMPLEEKLKQWGQNCSENIHHKYLLIQAEKARLRNQMAKAIDLYEQAIIQAKVQGYIYEEALANELAAKFYLNWDKEKIAQTYMIEAYYCYARWGAKAKTEQLEQTYPQLLASILQQPQSPLPFNASISLTSHQTVYTSTSTNTSVLDLSAAVKASQTLSGEIELEALLSQLMQIVLENAGADKAALILNNSGVWEVVAECKEKNCQLSPTSVEKIDTLPLSIIRTVQRTQKTVILNQVKKDKRFASDRYLIQQQPKSLFCTPILSQNRLIGILYLENNLSTEAFTTQRIEVLNLLCSQAAISIENARLYRQSQNYAAKLEGTVQELQQTQQQLQHSFEELQQAQLQLVQSEKMSALGNLVAGVAHEINNPLGFINGNIAELFTAVEDITEYINCYESSFPSPGEEIENKREELDIEFLLEDLPNMLSAMKVGCDRIRGISTSLRTFSRTDTESKFKANLHDGIDSTLLILKYRLKAKEIRPEIEVIRDYGNILEINCFPGQLNQVFMNILANAIDMFDEMAQEQFDAGLEINPQQIIIRTHLIENHSVEIRISDNGKGMSEEVCSKIFDRKFTTKEVGKGTGLGLAIAQQIVEQTHGGKLTCSSQLGQGTEFTIILTVS